MAPPWGRRSLVNSGGPSDTRAIRGGPAWLYSDRYTILAETNDPIATGSTGFGYGTPATKLMYGPMPIALLEDRFQLKTHRESEGVPMYALTVAKNGLKLKPVDGSCVPLSPSEPNSALRVPAPDGRPRCSNGLREAGPNWTVDSVGAKFSNLAWALSQAMDRHVIDRTGIARQFSFHLEFASDENAPPDVGYVNRNSDIPPAASIFTAVEQLGLKLEPIKGPRGFIVIDHIERPSEN